ncbi:MAG: hypothetical protein ACKVT0_09190 [Planctomycetaceae bacterium]
MPALLGLVSLGGRSVEEDDDGNATCSRILLAKVDVRNLSEVQILALIPSPYIVGLAHPDYPFLFVNRRAAVQDASPSAQYWTITVSYSNKKTAETDDPLAAPAVISVDTLFEEREIFEDRDGEAITNKAGDPIEGLRRRVRYAEFTIEKNLWPLPSWIFEVQDSTNSSPFYIRPTGDPVGTLIPTEWAMLEYFKPGKPQKLNGQWYFATETKIIAKKDGFRDRILNRGFRSREFGPSSFPTPIPGISEPALLDVDGKWIKNPTLGSANFIEVKRCPLFDFNTLGVLT